MARKAARKTTKAGKVASKKTARKSTAHAKLKTYRAKRDFRKTAEPQGGGPTASGRSFVTGKQIEGTVNGVFKQAPNLFSGVAPSWAIV